ncbi:hypothetical protein EV121DRAFT_278776 [Schizophyllum commune]
MTEGDKLRLKQQGLEFMDITEHPSLGTLNAQRPQRFVNPEPKLSAQSSDAVRALLTGEITTDHMRADITKLSSFWNRSYRSNWGLLSSNWVFDHVSSIIAANPSDKTRTSVTKFPHKFVQNSVVLRLDATDDSTPDEEKELVIVGAHQDSLNYRLPFFRAPGSDDDGSGTVTVFQILRSLVEQEFVPPKGIAVEFHWYAAEEGGLLGSQDVAAFYEAAEKKVKGMLQMDMTAFVKSGTEPKIAFFKDQVDKNLTTFATKLVEAYSPLPWNLTTCGLGCGSDHMSWTKAGYPAIFATEGFFEGKLTVPFPSSWSTCRCVLGTDAPLSSSQTSPNTPFTPSRTTSRRTMLGTTTARTTSTTCWSSSSWVSHSSPSSRSRRIQHILSNGWRGDFMDIFRVDGEFVAMRPSIWTAT